MDDIILKVENISKQYRLGVVGTGTLSHDLNRLWHKVRGKEDPYLTVGAVNDRSAVASSDYVWALKDINFEVKQGEILGIIGKNGAGKSTLLKILSRVTSPTTGSIKTRGRIASLLEVGTGMHPELTGRENVYLNGAILGMTKAEIASKIEEIIDFSGCEMYIDTPVKRYSSGMRVRLGFAVAAFLEPDILVVDEVLAVGDAEFQKKAIGKMQDISNTSGRTVLFVSHNMAAVRNLCTRTVVLKNGAITFKGETNEALQYYLNESNLQDKLINLESRKGNGSVLIKSVTATGKDGHNLVMTGGVFNLTFDLDNSHEIKASDIVLDFRIEDNFGQRISWFSTKLLGYTRPDQVVNKITFTRDRLDLNNGVYHITWQLRVKNQVADWVQNGFSFMVNQGYYYRKSIFVSPSQARVLLNFKTEIR